MIPIRIIMADDHEIFREGFAAMFRDHSDIQLVDQAHNGEFLIAQVVKHKPDVVLTDIQMEGMDGIEATRIICRRFPNLPVIAMSMYEDTYTIMEMLKAGASGYVVKNAGKQVVMEAIKAAHIGEHFYCRSASKKIAALTAAGRLDPNEQARIDFTPIEERIIRLICEEYESKDIANELNLEVNNIAKYRKIIFQKAEVNSTAGLVLFAIRNGLFRL
jgi:DNA-binding NarL/FixJ family response regulator